MLCASARDAYVVYSVGPNGTDDRGAEVSAQVFMQTQGRGPEARMTGDLGVRIRITSGEGTTALTTTKRPGR